MNSPESFEDLLKSTPVFVDPSEGKKDIPHRARSRLNSYGFLQRGRRLVIVNDVPIQRQSSDDLVGAQRERNYIPAKREAWRCFARRYAGWQDPTLASVWPFLDQEDLREYVAARLR